MDSCPRPFKGVVLCATGIQDKVGRFGRDGAHLTTGLTFSRRLCSRLRWNLVPNIARTSPSIRPISSRTSMGVQSTVWVDWLRADGVADTLVQCALQMRIPILRSVWVTECHAIWKQGDDVDLREVPPSPTMGGASANVRSHSRASRPTDSLSSPSS